MCTTPFCPLMPIMPRDRFHHTTVGKDEASASAWCFSSTFFLYFAFGHNCGLICLVIQQLVFFRVVISSSLCLLVPMQEKNQHIVYRVPDMELFPFDCPGRPQSHYSFIYYNIYPWIQFSFCKLIPSSARPAALCILSCNLSTCPFSLTCFHLPVSRHPICTITLPSSLSFLFDPLYSTPFVSAGSVILICADGWAITHNYIHPWSDDCALSLSWCLSRDTQNAPWTIQNQRGTQASTVKETLTRWRRSWFPGKVWGVLRDKSVTTLPPEVKMFECSSHYISWNPFSISKC